MSSLTGVNEFLANSAYREQGAIPAFFEDEQGAGRFVDFFEESRARQERWSYWFKSFATLPKASVSTQIADLLAHEVWRRVKEELAENPRPLRESFKRMIAGGRVEVRWLDRPGCERNARYARDLLRRYPDGQIPPEDSRE